VRPPGIFGPLNAPPIHTELSLDHAFHTPLHDYPGSFTVTRQRAFVGAWAPLPGPFLFGLDIETEASTYDGSWGLVFGGNHLNETLWQVSIGPKLVWQVNDRVTLYVGTVFFFAGALNAEVHDSLRYELDLATQVKVTPRIALTIGAGLRTSIEDSPSFYPILGLEWPRLKLFLEGGIFKTQYALVKKVPGVEELDVIASFGVDLRQYRLAEHAATRVTDVPGGVVRDTRYPLTVGAAYTPIPGLKIGLFGGANFGQKIEIDDHLGRRLGRSSAGPAPFLAFRFEIDI
jgi:hypothetical protein